MDKPKKDTPDGSDQLPEISNDDQQEELFTPWERVSKVENRSKHPDPDLITS